MAALVLAILYCECPELAESASSLGEAVQPLGSDDRRMQSARNAFALLYIRIYDK
jgi:hypothetical protein